MKAISKLSVALFLALLASDSHSQSYSPFTITEYDSSSTGYYFTSLQKTGGNPQGIPPFQMILDSTGNVVYYKLFTPGLNPLDFKLQPNGLISYGYDGQYFLMDSTFTIVDSIACKNGVTTDLHDLQILPNGNFLILGIEEFQMDLSSYPLFGINNVPGSATANVEAGVIQEQDALKNVVFEWHAKDYFSFTDVDTAWLNNPNQVDWTHCNALEQDADGNILLSSRHFNEITKINRQTGAVIWRLGGNANQFNFLNDPMQFRRQHDIRRIANGNYTLFDNGDGAFNAPYHYASGKEYQLDEVNLTANLIWSYTDDVTEFSPAMGNFQRYIGGNSVISYGITSSHNKVFNVVNDAGQKVFEISFNDTLRSYRSFNYPTLPWTLNRPQVTCYEITGQYYLDAGAGHASYLWSNGLTTQMIPVTTTGSYSVFVPIGQGGFISSETIFVSDLSDPCNTLAISEHQSQANISAYPNPFHDELQITVNNNRSQNPVQLINSSGKIIFSIVPDESIFDLEVKHLAAGIYLLRYENVVKKIVKF